MKELTIKIRTTFDITNEIPTYGSDGTKHRIGSFEGNGAVYIEFMGKKAFLYSYFKEKRRNQYSGRLDTFLTYCDRENILPNIRNFLLTIAKENNLKIGKDFDKATLELSKNLKNETYTAIFRKVFSYKIIAYSIEKP